MLFSTTFTYENKSISALVLICFFHYIILVWSLSALSLFWFSITGSREISQGQHAICSRPLICFVRLGRVPDQLLQTAPWNPGATPDYRLPSRCVHEEESRWWVHIRKTGESKSTTAWQSPCNSHSERFRCQKTMVFVWGHQAILYVWNWRPCGPGTNCPQVRYSCWRPSSTNTD